MPPAGWRGRRARCAWRVGWRSPGIFGTADVTPGPPGDLSGLGTPPARAPGATLAACLSPEGGRGRLQLLAGGHLSQVRKGPGRGHPPPRRALEESLLQEVGLVGVLDGV